jgi:GMP synthase (glutamine-hydrolysing)
MSILIFEHTDTCGAERLATTLRDYGHRLRMLRLHDGDAVPFDLDGVDGIITCGGPQSANDDSVSWLAPQMDLLKSAHANELPIVGLCLGSQILARTFGGSVEKNPAGLEFGWHEVKLSPAGREDALHAGLGWQMMQFHHHREHVAQLPSGARLLAGSAKTKVQAWALGLRTYAFQYHPEVTLATIENWAKDEPEVFAEIGSTPERLREENRQHFAAFERITQRLFESIALFLMPVDRRQRGLVKDLHY